MDNKTPMHSPEKDFDENFVHKECTSEDNEAVKKIPETKNGKRKVTKVAQHQNFAFQKALLDAIPLPVYYKDTQGRYIGANSAFIHFFGVSEHDLVGKNVYDITSKPLAEVFSAKDAELFQNPGQQEFEIQMLDYNQKPHDVIFYKSTFRDINGELGGIIGVIQEISERKQAEESLHKSEMRLRDIIENADEIIFTISPEGIFTFASPAWTRFLGHRVDEVVGSHLKDFVHPEFVNHCVKALNETIINSENRREIEYLVRHKNGEWRWHSTIGTPLKDENGKTQYIIGIAQDITDRKKTKAALKAATDELEEFFSSAIDLLSIVDSEGRFQRLNREWENVLGYSLEEMVGHNYQEFIHPDDIQPTFDYIKEQAINSEVGNLINRYRGKDGAYHWIEWRSKPVGNKSFAAARDITKRVNAENALRESEERYRNFVANTSEGIFRTDFTEPIKIDQPYEVLVEQCVRCAVVGEVNAAFSAAYGLEPKQMVGHPFREYSPSCGVQFADLIKTEDFRIKEREETDLTADGQPIYIVENYYGVVENGELIRVWGVQRDITQRKRAEKLVSLQHDLAISLSAVSGLNDGLQLCLETAIKSSEMDCGGIYLYDDVSDELNLLVHQGLSPEFINVASTFKSNTPNMRLVMAGSPVYSQHPKLGFPHDEPLKFEALSSIAIVPINYQNRVIGCMNIASHSFHEIPKFSRDMLEAVAAQMGNVISRLRSEEALRESEHRFRSIFDHAQDGILVVDSENQQILFGNKKFSEMLGHTQEELKKFHISDIHPRDVLPHVKDHFIKTLKGEAPAYEIPTMRKDGSIFVAEIIAFEITLQGESCLVGLFRDITERKRAEEALRNSEEMLSSILEATPVGVGLLKDRGFIKINKALTMITGYSEKDLLGNKTRIMYPDDDEYARMEKDLYSEMEKMGLAMGEAHLQHKNGALIDVILCLSPFDPNDLSKGITTTVLDITRRKQAEKALHENEALIGSLFASVPVGLALIKDRVFVKVNETLCKMSGYSEAEFLGAISRKFYATDEDFYQTGSEIYEQIERNGIGISEARFRQKNGALLDVLLCMSPLDSSDVSKGITLTVTDITDRIQAEKALRESEKKYRSVIENIQDVFYRADLNGRLLMGSPSGANMFGYGTVDAMIGKPLEIFWANPLDRQKIMNQVKITGSVKDFEAQLKREDGSTFIASFTTHLFYDDNGNLLGTEGIIRDISKQKKADEEIRQLNEELEQRVFDRTHQLETAVQEMEAFSYSVSHDLRAPLRAINGYANILMEEYSPQLDEEGNRVCGVISKETQRMSHLIDDLLSFARIGRVELQPNYINMHALVNSLILDQSPLDEQQRTTFQVAPLESGIGDSNLLRQVWMNLISNAIKFTSHKEKAIIQINSEHNENEVIYSIKDNGEGFDMRYVNNLFGVFNRLHNDKDFEGTGVGLAIVKRIIDRHAGRTWAEGEVGKGATFYFSLPKRESIL